MRTLIVGAVLFFASAGPLLAEPITYTETVIGSGIFGGTLFNDKRITIVGQADTSGIGGLNVLYNVDTSTTVNVEGIGTATFTDGAIAFVSQIVPYAVGFASTPLHTGADILDTETDAAKNYALGFTDPIPGTGRTNTGLTFPTTLGDFGVYSTSGTSVWDAAVPEPASVCVLAPFVVGILASRRR